FYPFYYDEENNILSIDEIPNAIKILPKLSDRTDGRWRWGKDTARERISELVAQKVKGRDEYDVFQKDYLPEEHRVKPKSFWTGAEFSTGTGTREVKEILGKDIFTTPKPLALIQKILQQATDPDSLILDFFSGSATTAHAVMKLNSEDGGRRKFILVQLPELTPENSEARKAGYETICDIGEERIKRAGKKIKEERPLDFENLDIGFRVFKVDSSNMQDVYYKPEDLTQGQLELLADNIKPGRTSEDLLIQAMLDMGVSLSSEIKETEINGKKIFHVKVNNNYLIACFDDDVSSEAVQAIAELKPDYAVFKDAGIANNSVMTNFDQIFNAYSPGTVRRIL
ncbi:MAG: site-specific DNA-methyltransferase, partial [Synergistaceae bacterium]|nr:site-specific DNA-methyltransferase [Synergistaceae bacterium]